MKNILGLNVVKLKISRFPPKNLNALQMFVHGFIFSYHCLRWMSVFPSSYLSTFHLIDFHDPHFCDYDCLLIGARTTSGTQRERLSLTHIQLWMSQLVTKQFKAGSFEALDFG